MNAQGNGHSSNNLGGYEMSVRKTLFEGTNSCEMGAWKVRWGRRGSIF